MSLAASTGGSSCTVPRHRGNSVHPQNSLPAFTPRRAVRRTIGRSHLGQFGTDSALCAETPLMILFYPMAACSFVTILHRPYPSDAIGNPPRPEQPGVDPNQRDYPALPEDFESPAKRCGGAV